MPTKMVSMKATAANLSALVAQGVEGVCCKHCSYNSAVQSFGTDCARLPRN